MSDLGIAISVHAPWAWAMMHACKDVENRSRNFPRRRDGREVLGRVWVHASLWPGARRLVPYSARAEDLADACDDMRRRASWAGVDVYNHREFGSLPAKRDELRARIDSTRGHIVGSVEVYGYADSSDSPWYVPGSLAILVRNPRPLRTPVPAKGALGWWRPEESVLAACREGT